MRDFQETSAWASAVEPMTAPSGVAILGHRR
jgi:hypothetical protein